MKSIFFISDRTGITSEVLGNTLLTQFSGLPVTKEYLPFIDSEDKAEIALTKIKNNYLQYGEKPILITSIANLHIRNKFKLSYVLNIDFFESFLPLLEQEFAQKASQKVGMSHGINDEEKYYKRIDAIDFSLFNDDGATVKNYDKADVILIGVSRVGKTPTCLYLAVNYGVKAANYPLVENDFLSDKLPKVLRPYCNKVFGLTIEPEKLYSIRQSRLPNSIYSNLNICKKELLIAEKLMNINHIPVLNTSKKSIEEISVEIMQKIKLYR